MGVSVGSLVGAPEAVGGPGTGATVMGGMVVTGTVAFVGVEVGFKVGTDVVVPPETTGIAVGSSSQPSPSSLSALPHLVGGRVGAEGVGLGVGTGEVGSSQSSSLPDLPHKVGSGVGSGVGASVGWCVW